MCSQFTSIHVTCCLPKTSIPFRVGFPVFVSSRYMLSPNHQHSLQCCEPNSCPFTLFYASQRPGLPSVLCYKFTPNHVIRCLQKTSISSRVVYPFHVHSRYLLSPKEQHSLQCCFPGLFPFTLLAVTQKPSFPSVLCYRFLSIHVNCCFPKTSISFSVVFPVHVNSLYLLSSKDEDSLQCCVPSSCPFTLLAVSQRPAFPSVL